MLLSDRPLSTSPGAVSGLALKGSCPGNWDEYCSGCCPQQHQGWGFPRAAWHLTWPVPRVTRCPNLPALPGQLWNGIPVHGQCSSLAVKPHGHDSRSLKHRIQSSPSQESLCFSYFHFLSPCPYCPHSGLHWPTEQSTNFGQCSTPALPHVPATGHTWLGSEELVFTFHIIHT